MLVCVPHFRMAYIGKQENMFGWLPTNGHLAQLWIYTSYYLRKGLSTMFAYKSFSV